ncbi:uncharacterized protein LOC106637939 [Copidosoma floridanum]|uniref:uncharacterized protein LOC106637939 n=1 Tax=Copidosoma floridanum TaxID=29053 RepID=UPI0006C9686D|nr:uncharacterized protein LOC106637939 [Copidosoma floridanum]
MAYCLRFLIRLYLSWKQKDRQNKDTWFNEFSFLQIEIFDQIKSPILCLKEIKQAKLYWVAVHQRHYFVTEIDILLANTTLPLEQQKPLPLLSKLVKLSPFLDEGLIRVGERLKNLELKFSNKHPLVLLSDELLTTIIIHATHLRCLHGSPRITLVNTRQEFWIVGGLQTVNSVTSRSVTCINYAGPVKNRLTKTRGKITTNGWIAVFICLCTRTVHLEIVKDYSTEAFITVFTQFTSRRGAYSELYSDQATNFIRAEKELAQMLNKFSQSYPKSKLAEMNTTWHYNPLAAPHFGPTRVQAWSRDFQNFLAEAFSSELRVTMERVTENVVTADHPPYSSLTNSKTVLSTMIGSIRGLDVQVVRIFSKNIGLLVEI